MKCQVIWSKRSNSETFALLTFSIKIKSYLPLLHLLTILPFSIVTMKLSNNKISKAKLIFQMMISSSLINVNFVAKEIIINLVLENLFRRKKILFLFKIEFFNNYTISKQYLSNPESMSEFKYFFSTYHNLKLSFSSVIKKNKLFFFSVNQEEIDEIQVLQDSVQKLRRSFNDNDCAQLATLDKLEQNVVSLIEKMHYGNIDFLCTQVRVLF